MFTYRDYDEKVYDLLELICKDDRKWTRRRLARILGYNSSNAVRKVLIDLAADGLIHEELEDRAQRVGRYVYWRSDRGCEYLKALQSA